MASFQIAAADFTAAAPWLVNQARLVVVDPPYNQGVKYDSFRDRMTPGDFCKFLMDLADACHRVMLPGATAAVIMGERYQAEAHAAFSSFDAFEFRRSIVWHYTFGQNQGRRDFTPAWAMIHVFGRKGGSYTFNPESVLVPSARQTKYKDKRAKPGGRVMDNLWTISRVCGTYREKVDYPNQLPLALTDRLVAVYSNPFDTVADLCMGSGTVGVSAAKHGRRFLGCDLSEKAVAIARSRILAAGGVDTGESAG